MEARSCEFFRSDLDPINAYADSRAKDRQSPIEWYCTFCGFSILVPRPRRRVQYDELFQAFLKTHTHGLLQRTRAEALQSWASAGSRR